MNKNYGHSQRYTYKAIKELIVNLNNCKGIINKDSDRTLWTGENCIINRWKEHFGSIFNRPILPWKEIPAKK